MKLKSNYLKYTLLIPFILFGSVFADVSSLKGNLKVNTAIDTLDVFAKNNLSVSLSNRGAYADYRLNMNYGLALQDGQGAQISSIFHMAPWFTATRNSGLVGFAPQYQYDLNWGPYDYAGDDADNVHRIYQVTVEMLSDPENHYDFQNWPVSRGAPWVDVDGDGQYNPLPAGSDHPKFYGDAVAYFVSADNDQSQKDQTNSPISHVELQTTAFKFNGPNNPDYLNVVFYRSVLVNNSTEMLNDAYFGLFVDPDLGFGIDDLIGVSVDNDMVYTYNDSDSGAVAFGGKNYVNQGIKLIQGPLVDCTPNESVDISLLGTDADDDDITFFIDTQPSNGTVSISGNIATYTANENFSGTDSFTYGASDGLSNSDTSATVTLLVTNQQGSNLPTISYPNGNENLVSGDTYTIIWDNGFNNTGIELYKGAVEVLDISGDVGNVTSYSWTVPAVEPGIDYRIRIYDAGTGESEDFSDNYFTISSQNKKTDTYNFVNDIDLFLKSEQAVDSHFHNHDYSQTRDKSGFVRCATDELEEHLKVVNPEYIKKRDEFLIKARNSMNGIERTNTTVNIPVIFHVLYNDTSDNISKELIGAQFDQINLDFSNTNSDGSKVPQVPNPSDAPYDPNIDYSHASVRGSHDVRFFGANGEQNGNDLIENVSIIRYNISTGSVSGVSQAASLVNSTQADNGATGGFQSGYMNIYIAPLGGGLLGQATLGGTTHCVVLTESVGSVDTPGSAAPYDLGRTLTHELGHNFSYNHIFNSPNCSSQEISDIPAQTSPNGSGANVYEYNNAWYGKGASNNCIGTSGKGDQFVNYMDYSADADLIMFSAGQAVNGYSWASAVQWADVTGSNTSPVVSDINVNAIINESCGVGGQIFGQSFPNKKNLSLSSVVPFFSGNATFVDPINIEESRNVMLGKLSNGQSMPSSVSGDLNDQKFAFYGDPSQAHSTSNPLDDNYADAGDRRFVVNTGPFTLAPYEKQEIVFAVKHNLTDSSTYSDQITELNGIASNIENDYKSVFNNFNESAFASFTVSASSGYAPLEVDFDASSSSIPLNSSVQWDFDGDGQIDSESLSPTFVYNDPGSYDPVLNIIFQDYENGNAFLNTESYSLNIVANVLSTVPSVSNVSLQTDEEVAVSHTLIANNPLTTNVVFSITQNAQNGSVELNDATLTYTPNVNFFGADSIKYQANNGTSDSNIGVILINVQNVDDDPTTFDVNVSTNEDDAIEIDLLVNEYDGDSYSFEIKQGPSNGALGSISGSTVTYVPNKDWVGVDVFTYEASDNKYSSKLNIATVAVTVLPVNDAPVSENMNIQSFEDAVTAITLDVSDVDGDNLNYVIISGPTNGTINGVGDNSIEYTPNENYNGADVFSYKVTDGLLESTPSQVVINLAPVNDRSSEFNASDKYIVLNDNNSQLTVTTNVLMVTPEIEKDTLLFKWDKSHDIDGDLIKYRMVGYEGLEFLTMDNWTEDLNIKWSLKDLIAATDTVNTVTGAWLIEATDGEFIVKSNEGVSIDFSINGSALIPEQYLLSQNYPNPFKNSTTIKFDNPFSQRIIIRIYNVQGILIKELLNEEVNAGFNNVVWDGTNNSGEKVSAGIYFYQINASSDSNGNKFIKSKKLLKLN